MITSQLKYFNFDSTFKKSGSNENPTFQMPLANNELNYCSVTEVKIPKIYNITDQIDNNGVPMNRITLLIGGVAPLLIDSFNTFTIPVGSYSLLSLCLEITRQIYVISTAVVVPNGAYLPLLVMDIRHPENDFHSIANGYSSSYVWLYAMYAIDHNDIIQDMQGGGGLNIIPLTLTFSRKLLNILGYDQLNASNTIFLMAGNQTTYNPEYLNPNEPYNFQPNNQPLGAPYNDHITQFYGLAYVFTNVANLNYYSNIYIVCTSPQIITNNIIPGYPSNQVIAVIDTSGAGYPYIVSEKNNLLLNHNTLGNKGSGDISFAYYDADYNLIQTYGVSTSIRLAFYHFEPIKNDAVTNSYVTTNNATLSTNKVVGNGVRY